MIEVGSQTKKYLNRKMYKPPPADDNTSNYKKLIVVIIMSLVFISGQFIGGYISGSISVVSDAFHLVTDLMGFVVAFIFLWFVKKKSNQTMTFGYHRMQLLGALANLFIIWALAIFLMYEATLRIINKEFVQQPLVMLIVACVGLPINIVMYFVLHGGGEHSHGLMAEACGQEYPTQINQGSNICSQMICEDIQCLVSNQYEEHCHKKQGQSQQIHKHQIKVIVEDGHIVKRKGSEDNKQQKVEHQHKNCKHNHGEHKHDHNGEHKHDHGDHQHSNQQSNKNEANNQASKKKKSKHNHKHDHKHQHKHQHKQGQKCNHNHQKPKQEQKVGESAANIRSEMQHDGHDHSHHGHSHDHDHGHGHSHENLSMKGAILHALSDIIQSIGLVISSLIIFFAGSNMGQKVTEWNDWHYCDPITTYIFSIIVFISTWPITKNCYQIIMESIPGHLTLKQVQQEIQKIQGVVDVHDLHIWDLRPGKTILIAHVFSKKGQQRAVLKKLTDICRKKRIYHSTFQVQQQELRDDQHYILCDHDIH